MFKLINKHPLISTILLLLIIFIVFHQWILTQAGYFLIKDELFAKADAAVVLNTGAELYPRLIEAAELYKMNKVSRVIINGNRKTDVLRKLEAMGFQAPAPWYESNLRVLEVLGVPRDKVIAISGEDVYDTISEARLVGNAIIGNKLESIVVTTSKSHTRRAAYIWQDAFGEQLKIYVRPAQTDPYQADAWWQSGRQIRWVLAEYGAWLYLYWKKYLAVS